VVVGALVVGLTVWAIRRRKGRAMIEPTAEKVRSDFR
jgi:hypothetical protein